MVVYLFIYDYKNNNNKSTKTQTCMSVWKFNDHNLTRIVILMYLLPKLLFPAQAFHARVTRVASLHSVSISVHNLRLAGGRNSSSY